MEKQRLIRKDTPHYKKHFKITKLPKPEAVVALLQGLSTDGVPREEEELGGCNNNTEPEDPEEAWDEDDRKNGVLSAQPPVKVRPCGEGVAQRGGRPSFYSELPTRLMWYHWKHWQEAPALQDTHAEGSGAQWLSKSCAMLLLPDSLHCTQILASSRLCVVCSVLQDQFLCPIPDRSFHSFQSPPHLLVVVPHLQQDELYSWWV